MNKIDIIIATAVPVCLGILFLTYAIKFKMSEKRRQKDQI